MNQSPLAVVHPEAKIGQNVTIDPFAVIEKDVVIGDKLSYLFTCSHSRRGKDRRQLFHLPGSCNCRYSTGSQVQRRADHR